MPDRPDAIAQAAIEQAEREIPDGQPPPPPANANGYAGAEADPFEVIVENVTDIRSEPKDWLLKPWLCRGKFHLAVGPKAIGKTTAMLSWAALLSRGAPPFPRPGTALLICQEDDWADTLKPVLEVADANEHNLKAIRRKRHRETGMEVAIDLGPDMPGIIAQARKLPDVDLILLDPVIRMAANKTDSYNPNQVRDALMPLAELAEITNAAIVGITHFRKAKGGSMVDEVLGSGAWTQVARAILPFKKAEALDGVEVDYPAVIGVTGNLAPARERKALPFRIDSSEQDPDVPVVRFGEAFIRDIEAEMDGEPSETAADQARAWIQKHCPPGVPVLAKELEDQAEQDGIAWRTLQRAKDDCGVKSIREGKQWCWLRSV